MKFQVLCNVRAPPAIEVLIKTVFKYEALTDQFAEKLPRTLISEGEQLGC